MHRAFHAQRRLVELNICPCRSCTQTSELKLKFVAHVGDVATQTIRRRKKIVGMDVIYVHRLLKNAVPVPEYLLVSEDLFRAGGPAAAELPMHEIGQDLEGIGPVQTFYVGVDDLPAPLAPLPDPSWAQRAFPPEQLPSGEQRGCAGSAACGAIRAQRARLTTVALSSR